MLTVSPTSVSPGDDLTVTTADWLAASTITATLTSDPVALGTLTADAGGRASASFRIPAGVPAGSHTLELSGTGPGGGPRTLRTTVAVTDRTTTTTTAAGRPAGTLSRTGAQVFRLVWNGVALALAGVLLLVTAARRQWASHR